MLHLEQVGWVWQARGSTGNGRISAYDIWNCVSIIRWAGGDLDGHAVWAEIPVREATVTVRVRLYVAKPGAVICVSWYATGLMSALLACRRANLERYGLYSKSTPIGSMFVQRPGKTTRD